MQNLRTLLKILILLPLFSTGYTQEWQLKKPMPIPRKGMCTVVLDSQIWVMGGSRGRQHHGSMLDIVQAYDPKTDSWNSQLPSLNMSRENATAQVYNGKIYVFGGREGPFLVEEVEMYDPEKKEWQIVSKIPTPRFGLASVRVDSSIWLVGGSSAPNRFHDLVEVYHPDSNRWEQLAARMNYPRGDPMAMVLDNKVWVFGGHFYGPLANFEQFDNTTNSWTAFMGIPYEIASAGYSADTRIGWMVGGRTRRGISNKLLTFSITDQNYTWSEGPELNVPRMELSLENVYNVLYAIGGITPHMRGLREVDVVEALDVQVSVPRTKHLQPKETVLMRNYPNPFNDKSMLYVNLPANDRIRITLYNIFGQQVKQVYDGFLFQGEHRFSIDMYSNTSDPSTGMYFVRLKGQRFFKTIKIQLLK